MLACLIQLALNQVVLGQIVTFGNSLAMVKNAGDHHPFSPSFCVFWAPISSKVLSSLMTRLE